MMASFYGHLLLSFGVKISLVFASTRHAFQIILALKCSRWHSIAHHSSIFPQPAPVGTLLYLTPCPSPEGLYSPPLHVTMKILEPGTLHAVFFLFIFDKRVGALIDHLRNANPFGFLTTYPSKKWTSKFCKVSITSIVFDNPEYFENVDDDDVCRTNGIGAGLSESLRVLKFLSVRVFKVQLHSPYLRSIRVLPCT